MAKKGYVTTEKVPVADVLEHAKHLKNVLVLGREANGELYAAASDGNSADQLWLMEEFKHRLLSGEYDVEVKP